MRRPQHLLAFAPAVEHHRHRADVHAVGGQEEQVTAHAVEFAEEHAHPDRALGNVVLDAEQLLDGHREDEFVVQRTQVVHAGDVRATLEEGEFLAGLLHAGVQVTDDRLAAQHGFALQLEHEAQHTVGTRVLRTHVDDHRLILVGVGRNLPELGGLGLAHTKHRTDLAQKLARADLASRAHLLRSFVRLTNVLHRGHEFAPLN